MPNIKKIVRAVLSKKLWLTHGRTDAHHWIHRTFPCGGPINERPRGWECRHVAKFSSNIATSPICRQFVFSAISHTFFWTHRPTVSSYRLTHVCTYVRPLPVFLRNCPKDHSILCNFIELGLNKGRKVTEPDFWEEIPIVSKLWKCPKIDQNRGFSKFSWKPC